MKFDKNFDQKESQVETMAAMPPWFLASNSTILLSVWQRKNNGRLIGGPFLRLATQLESGLSYSIGLIIKFLMLVLASQC